MKKNIIKALLLVFITAFTGCTENDNEENVYSGDNFISFGTSTSGSALESATDAITITAYASVANIQSDFTVDVDIVAAQGTSADYTVIDGKTQFTFGPGKYVDQIQIKPIDNFDEDGNKIINLSLTSASNGSFIGFPGPDGNGKVFTVTFEDDDCAFTLAGLGAATWSGMDTASGTEGPNESQVTTSFDGTNLLIEGLAYGWLTNTGYWDEVVTVSNPVIAEVHPITGAVTIAEQPLCTTTWLGDVQPNYSIVATGQYVSCSKTLTITYDLLQTGRTSALRTFTETLTIN